MVLLCTVGNFFVPVVALISGIFVSALCQAVENRKISFVAEILFVIMCFAFPELSMIMPLVAYDTAADRRYFVLAAAVVAVILSFRVYNIYIVSFVVILAVLSAVLEYRTEQAEILNNKLMKLRDDSTEKNILLKEKNRQLRENHDNEVHIATLRERNRIAREIHDNVGHLLSRSILQVGALQVITADNEICSQGLAGINETLNNAMTTIRQSVHNLHDSSINLEYSLKEAIKPLDNKNITVKTEFDCGENIPNKIKLCFITIIKESVNNVIKHSNADKMMILIREHPAFYQLIIEDNGKCPQNINTNGIGLLNMQNRVETLNGIIRITPSESGFKIFISIPKDKGTEE
ncbi:MAG: histidine kinase [Clostridia bacterium]|nr:histidine kinase [Clostridia bacterium]